MDRSYFQRRLKTELGMAKAATNRCARAAHEGMAAGYRDRVASLSAGIRDRMSEPGRYSQGRALERWADDGGLLREAVDGATPV